MSKPPLAMGLAGPKKRSKVRLPLKTPTTPGVGTPLAVTPVPTPPPPMKAHVPNESDITIKLEELTIGDKKYTFQAEDLKSLGYLGEGNFGTVLKMLFPKTNTQMAVKKIPMRELRATEKSDIVELAVTMQTGVCPYIVGFYGCLIRDGDVWICMELLDSSMDKIADKVYKQLKETIPEDILGKMTVADDLHSPTNDAVYSNVDQPPVPPRQGRPVQTGPPLPPKQPSQRPRARRTKGSDSDKRSYFSKIFNGCPLHLNCASSWVHPHTKAQYVLLGADEGLFSLLVVSNNPDPVMEQVSSRACHWLRIVENSLIWLSGNSRFISTTNLEILFQTEAQKQSMQHSYGRSRQSSHTAKIPDSRNCAKCCISRNPFSDQRFLIAVIPKGILLMQWYQPQNAFKLVMVFEISVPSPVNTLEAFVHEDEEYPIVCFGIKEGNDGRLLFDTMNLNTQACWYTADKPASRDLDVLCLQQLEKNTFFVGSDRYAKFVDKNGEEKPNDLQASQLVFDRKSEHMVYLSNCVLSFHKHGMQGKSLLTQQVTAEVADGSKIFHLLGSHGNIIIETRPINDPSAPTNIYILVQEDQAQ